MEGKAYVIGDQVISTGMTTQVPHLPTLLDKGLSPQSTMAAAITVMPQQEVFPGSLKYLVQCFHLDSSYSLHLWSKTIIFLPFGKVDNYYLQCQAS